jgi:hypothetical protein
MPVPPSDRWADSEMDNDSHSESVIEPDSLTDCITILGGSDGRVSRGRVNGARFRQKIVSASELRKLVIIASYSRVEVHRYAYATVWSMMHGESGDGLCYATCYDSATIEATLIVVDTRMPVRSRIGLVRGPSGFDDPAP